MEQDDALGCLGALANRSRLDVFRLLVRAGVAGRAAGAIGAALGLPPATLSFHLSHLRHAGLIRVRREGRSLIYAVEYRAMNALLRYLTENCCQGNFDGAGAQYCDAPNCDVPNCDVPSCNVPSWEAADG